MWCSLQVAELSSDPPPSGGWALTGSADLRSADPVKAEFKRSLGMIGQ